MNIAEIDRVIGLLKLTHHISLGQAIDAEITPKQSFCMSDFGFVGRGGECGTPSCIAGWALAHQNEKGEWCYDDYMRSMSIALPKAAKVFDLDEYWVTNKLFMPESLRNPETGHRVKWDTITPNMAITALKNIKKAGDNYQNLSIQEVWFGKN